MGYTCVTKDCFNPVENQDLGLCASCNSDRRKAEKSERKANEKRSQLIKNKQLKSSQPRQKVNPISDKRKAEMEIYSEKRKQFLLNKWCAYHGQGCIPTTIHHAKGRVGSLYLDEKYWVALCMEAHEWVEKNPNEAKAKELSLSRLAVNQEKNSNLAV